MDALLLFFLHGGLIHVAENLINVNNFFFSFLWLECFREIAWPGLGLDVK
jgi:hypothetical protein